MWHLTILSEEGRLNERWKTRIVRAAYRNRLLSTQHTTRWILLRELGGMRTGHQTRRSIPYQPSGHAIGEDFEIDRNRARQASGGTPRSMAYLREHDREIQAIG